MPRKRSLSPSPSPPPPPPGFPLRESESKRRSRGRPRGTKAPVPMPRKRSLSPSPPPPGFPLRESEPKRRPRGRPRGTEAPAPAPAAASAVAAGGGDLPPAFERCRALLFKLLSDEDGGKVFGAPVDARALGLQDYYAVTQDPMDLGTVFCRLERGRYDDPRAFAADVRLTFRNAMSYNNSGDPVYKSAVALSKVFETDWRPILASLPPQPLTDAERKAKLRVELPRLPKAVQESAVMLLMAQDACILQQELKMKVDLDKVDAATLDKLERLRAEHILSGRRGRPSAGPKSPAER